MTADTAQGRRAKRLKSKLVVRYGAEHPTSVGVTEDISYVGFSLRGATSFPAQTILALEVVLPDGSISRMQGKVVWTRPVSSEAGPGQQVELGLVLITSDPAYRRYVDGLDVPAQAVGRASFAELVIVQGTNQGKRLSLGKQEVRIGRDASCDLVIPDPQVSRIHAVIRERGGSFLVYDEGSTNGIYVNNLKVDKALLQHRDQVRIGPCILQYLDQPDS